ncbi:MAG: response regulator [Bacteriovoracia bacterium]
MPLSNKSILIIDDDILVIDLVKKILTGIGIKCEGYQNIELSRNWLKEHIPHAILLDIKLIGEESGFDFLKEINSDPALNHIPVIILSQCTNSEAITKSFSLGAIDYIVKPIKNTVLLQKVRKALRDHKFPEYFFEDNKDSVVIGSFYGSISRISEVSCKMISNVRIANQTDIELRSKLLDYLKVGDIKIQSFGSHKASGQSGFETELSFRGIGEVAASKIRKFQRYKAKR